MQPPAGDSSVVFRARGLTKVYGEGDIQVQALRGIDLELRSGELVVLLGSSGSGKSTLVKMFSVRFEGDQVALRSTTAQRGSGDTITFIFSGTVSGDTISGPLYMGEYLNAKFTAKRYSYPAARAPILVPNGPRLANQVCGACEGTGTAGWLPA